MIEEREKADASGIEMAVHGGRLKIKTNESGDCIYVSESGCSRHEEWRPAMCTSYPAQIFEGELSFSLRCDWVAKKMLPSLSSRNFALSEEEEAYYRDLKKYLLDSTPQQQLDLWNEDLKHFAFRLSVDVDR
jgi:hypothetical protein